jgi:AraC family transcriptional regulator, transcriptional activator of pobA
LDEAATNLDYSSTQATNGGARMQPSRDSTGAAPAAPLAVHGAEIPSFLLYGEGPGVTAAHERLLHVETIAARGRFHNWKIRPHVHRHLHQLLLVHRGGGEAHTDSKVIQFRPPTLVIVPAGTVHAFAFEPNSEGFVASLASDLLTELAPRDRGIATVFDSAAILQLSAAAMRATDLRHAFHMFVREFNRLAPGRTAALEGLLVWILANVLRLSHTFGESTGAATGRHQLLIAQFRELIEHHFRHGRVLADYAQALNVSESRLRSACLQVTQQSPMRLVHARLLLEAQRQLLYTNRNVSEIAYGLGFDDLAYFTRFFTQRAGISPRGFRLRQLRAS